MKIFKKHRFRLYMVIAVGCVCISCTLNQAKTEIEEQEKLDTTVTAKRTEPITIPTALTFLDSIAQLPDEPYFGKLGKLADSVFRQQQQVAIKLTPKQFEKLKSARIAGTMDMKTATAMFPDYITYLQQKDDFFKTAKGVDVYWISFDENTEDSNYFALVLGIPPGMGHTCLVYFFNGNKVIGVHDIYNRYGLELHHFRNEYNQLVVYYDVCFGSGTGLFFSGTNYYCYTATQLVPALSTYSRSYCSNGLVLKSIAKKIVTTQPLQQQYVRSYEFYYSDFDLNQLNDSIVVAYTFDKATHTYTPATPFTVQETQKMLVHDRDADDIVFLKAYTPELKDILLKGTQEAQQALLKSLSVTYFHWKLN